MPETWYFSGMKTKEDFMIDPVCGMTVAEPAKITCEHQGKTYGFCCEHCRTRFLADPAQTV